MTLLVLASGSPRRRQLLAELGVAFEIRPADVDETPRVNEDAAVLVHRLAADKAQAGLQSATEADIVVLAADTVVSVDGEVLGKPVDAADAARMLGLLSGSRHQVLTGVAVAARRGPGEPPGEPAPEPTVIGPAVSLAVEVVTTHVQMRPWTAAEIDAYVASGEPMDKAGSYAIQEVGDQFVVDIDGSFDNVVGLDVDVARRMLADAGLDLPDDPRAGDLLAEGQPPEV